MLTVIIKRTDEPKVIQMTQEDVSRQLSSLMGSEILLEDTWLEGIRKVRTPYFCLMEPDCVLSANYLSSNVGLLKKASTGAGSYRGGGNVKLAMIASCLGVETFANRIYNYRLGKVEHKDITDYQAIPNRDKNHTTTYETQIGFVPGAIIRLSAIKDIIDTFKWDDDNLVRLSLNLSFYFWATNRRVSVNPNTTYVSGDTHLEEPLAWDVTIPTVAANIFSREGLQ